MRECANVRRSIENESSREACLCDLRQRSQQKCANESEAQREKRLLTISEKFMKEEPQKKSSAKSDNEGVYIVENHRLISHLRLPHQRPYASNNQKRHRNFLNEIGCLQTAYAAHVSVCVIQKV